jgi:hypothetical protein
MTTRTEFTDLEWELLIGTPCLWPGASARCSQPRRTVNQHTASGRASARVPPCGSPPARSRRNRGAVPGGCQSPGASSAPLRPPVIPATPVDSLLDSSVELPSTRVRAECPSRASGKLKGMSGSVPLAERVSSPGIVSVMLYRPEVKYFGS